MSDIDSQKMVELASLQRKIDHGQSCSTSEIKDFERGLAKLAGHDFIVMNLAVKLLEGKKYSTTTENPDTVARCRSFASHMGASVEQIREGGHLTQIIFRPAPRQ